MFLSSHILSEVERTCDRVAIIRDGQLVKVDRVEALRDLAHHEVELRFVDTVPAEAFTGAARRVRRQRRGPHAPAARLGGRSRRSSRPPPGTSCSTSSAASRASRRPSSPSTATAPTAAGGQAGGGVMTAVGQAALAVRPAEGQAVEPDLRPRHRLRQDAARLAARRDHRRAAWSAAFLLSSGAAFGEAYNTPQSRQELVNLVNSLPPGDVRACTATRSRSTSRRSAGRSRWKTGASLGAHGRAVVRARAVRDARGRGPPRQPRVRRHDAARHAPDRRREARRSPDRHGHRRRSSRHCRPTSPGPRSRRSPATRSRLGRARVRDSGSASWRSRRAPSPSRSPARRPRGVGGHRRRDPRRRLLRQRLPGGGPGLRRRRQPDLVGLDRPPPAARRRSSTGSSLVPAAIVAIVLFAVGVELFARRDLGVTTRIPWPSIPTSLMGLGGPGTRSLGERWPLAVSWGIGVGLMGFIFGAASLSLTGALEQPVARDAADLPDHLPQHRPQRRRRVPPARVRHVRDHPRRVRGRDAGEGLGVRRGGRPARDAPLDADVSRPLGARGRPRLFAAIGVMTLVIATGVGIGSALAGGDVATPIVGTVVFGLYAHRPGRHRHGRRRPRDARRSPARSSPPS